jgi:hypothetical protein
LFPRFKRRFSKRAPAITAPPFFPFSDGSGRFAGTGKDWSTLARLSFHQVPLQHAKEDCCTTRTQAGEMTTKHRHPVCIVLSRRRVMKTWSAGIRFP